MATKAQWSDYLRDLTVYPKIGAIYTSMAKLFVALAPRGPEVFEAADLRVNWTDMGTAGVPDTSTFATNATAGYVGDSKDYQFAKIVGVNDVQDELHTEKQRNQGLEIAIKDVYKKWATDILAGAGTHFTLYGFDTQITAAEATPLGSDYFTVSGVEADTIKLVTDASSRLETIEGVLVCNRTGYNTLMEYAIAAAKGAFPTHIAMASFGFGDVPHLMGMPIIINPNISNVGDNTYVYMVNTSIVDGIQIAVPANQGVFVLKGPIDTRDYIHEQYQIRMRTQCIYPTPRGVVKIAINTA